MQANENIDHECNCLACRLQTTIIEQVSDHALEAGPWMAIDAAAALDALIPTVAMLAAGLEYEDAEAWWREVLTERSKAMLPDEMEFGESYKGRA